MAERVISVIWKGVDAGATRVANGISGGLTNVARTSERAQTQMAGMGGMLSREWDRFQRSFGHAISYAAIYKLYQAYTNLKDFNSELGTLSAMLPNAGRGIDQLGEVALRISTETGAPLNDVQESINNIVQSIPNMSDAVRRHLVPAMAEIEAMASRVTDVDPRSFGSTVLAMATAFHGRQAVMGQQGPQLLSRIASELITTRFTTPRLTGQDLTQYLTVLQGGAIAGGFSLPQALALFTVAQRTIGRPAQSAQYLRQLMIRLRKPTAQEQPFYQQAGLSATDLANLTGPQILRQLIRHGLSLPGGLRSRDVQQAMQTGNLNLIAPTNQAAQFFAGAVGGRQQSLIAMDAIVRNLGQWQLQLDALRKGSGALRQEFERVRQRQSLQLMSNALSNTTTDLLLNFMPALSIGAGELTKFSGHLSTFTEHMRGWDRRVGMSIQRHLGFGTRNNVVGGALDTGLTVGGIVALRLAARSGGRNFVKGLRRLRAGRFGRFLGREGPEGEVLEGGVGANLLRPLMGAYTTEAALSALGGKATGTPSQPFWVVIHPYSRTTVPGLFKSTIGGGGAVKTAENDAKKVLPFTALLRRTFPGIISRGAGFVDRRALGMLGLTAAEAPAIADIARVARGKDPFGANAQQSPAQMMKEGYSATLAQYFTLDKNNNLVPRRGTPQWMVNALNSTRGSGKILGIFPGGQRDPNEGKATSLIQKVLSGQTPNTFMPPHARYSQQQLSKLNTYLTQQGVTQSRIDQTGLANIEALFLLEPTQELRRLLKPQKIRTKVPVQLWNQVGSPPTERGKTKVTRNRG